MIDPSIWKIIQRKITDRCSQAERQRLEEWMQKDPENEKLVTGLEEIWEKTPDEKFQVDVEEAWDKFHHREMSSTNQVSYQQSRSGGQSLAVKFMRVAAVVLIVALSGLLVWQYSEKSPTNSANHGDFYVMQDLVTKQGERARVKFSDGTSVILNAASALRFPQKFGGPKREVYLDGEAYFEVAHNNKRPFIVHTQGADVEVLGTEFNVRAWDEDADVGITVRQGKVSVSAKSNDSDNPEPVILTRGQHSTVEKGERPTAAQNVEIKQYLLWLNGGMSFNDTPFSQVVRQIERRFDVQVIVHDKQLLTVPLTASLQEANLEKVLKVISASMEIDYRKQGTTVEFRTSSTSSSNTNTNQK